MHENVELEFLELAFLGIQVVSNSIYIVKNLSFFGHSSFLDTNKLFIFLPKKLSRVDNEGQTS